MAEDQANQLPHAVTCAKFGLSNGKGAVARDLGLLLFVFALVAKNWKYSLPYRASTATPPLEALVLAKSESLAQCFSAVVRPPF